MREEEGEELAGTVEVRGHAAVASDVQQSHQRWTRQEEEEGEVEGAVAAPRASWSSSPAISATLPLPLLLSSVIAAAPSSPHSAGLWPTSASSSSSPPSLPSAYSSHRPVPIATSNLARPPPPSSLADLDALEQAAPAHLPQVPGEEALSHKDSAAAAAAGHRAMEEEEEGELKVESGRADGAEGAAPSAAVHPQPALSIEYAEFADEEAPGQSAVAAVTVPQPYRYGGGVYDDDDVDEEAKDQEEDRVGEVAGLGEGRTTVLSGTLTSSFGDTTVPYSHYALPRAGLPLQSSTLGSTTAPSTQPYSTASSLALLGPADSSIPFSPSVHSTPPHLRPSSALSAYSPRQSSPYPDERGTLQSALSVQSYDTAGGGGEDDEVDRGEVEGYEGGQLGEEGAYTGYQRTASYQYDDPAEVKEGEGEAVEGAPHFHGMVLSSAGAAALMAGGVREEKAREDDDDAGGADAGVVRVDVDDYPVAFEIELQRASSGLADQWQQPPVVAQTVRVEEAAVAGGLVVAPIDGFGVDGNENPEGRSSAVQGRPLSSRQRKSPNGKSANHRGRPTGRPALQHWPLFTAAIVVLDVVYFVAMLGWGSWTFASLLDNPMYGPDGATLLHFGARFTPTILLHAEHWRLIVSCILHAGIIHIIFSLCIGALYCFTLELEYGWYRVLTIWVGSGVFSQMFASLLSPDLISVGGGAALTGVVASWLSDFVHTHDRIVGKWQYLVRNLFTSGLVFVSGIFPFVDNWGLGSGAVMGFLLGLVLYAPLHRTREGRWKVHHLPIVVPAALLTIAAFAVVPAVLFHQSDSSAYSPRGPAHWIACVDTSYWSCHSGVPLDCYYDGQFQPGNSNATDSGYSGYC